MKNTWGVVSLDGIQKSLVSQSPFGISILGASFLQCFLFMCTALLHVLTQ